MMRYLIPARIILIRILISLFFTLIAITPSLGATYFFSSSNGSDQNSGLSEKNSWKNLGRLKSIVLTPGDHILLKRGDIWREPLLIEQSGNNDNFIVIAAYGEGPSPIISGSNVLNGWSIGSSGIYNLGYKGICNGLLENGTPIRKASGPELADGQWHFDGTNLFYRPTKGVVSDYIIEACYRIVVSIISQSHISIEGIEIYGGGGSGIWIVNSNNLRVRNCIVRANAGSGIGIANSPNKAGLPSSNILIKENTVSWNANGIYLISEGGAEGLQKIYVMGNHVEYNDYNEVWWHATKDGHGLGIQNTSDSYFGENEFRYNRTGPALWTASDRRSDNNIFSRNFVHHNQKWFNRVKRTFD